MSKDYYQQYENNIKTDSKQERILLTLYGKAIFLGDRAKNDIGNEDFEGANNKLQKIQFIIKVLMSSLDLEKGGEAAQNLYSLYDYIYNRLIDANLKKKIKIIDEVLDLLNTLEEGWQKAAKELGVLKRKK